MITFLTCKSHFNSLSIVTPRSLYEVTVVRLWLRMERGGEGGGLLETEKVMVNVLVGFIFVWLLVVQI